MKQLRLAALLLLLAIIIAAVTMTLYFMFSATEVRHIPAWAMVKNESVIGFNVDKTKLTFGSMPYNAPSYRQLIISPDTSRSTRVRIRAEGNISPYLKSDLYDFVLTGNESRKVTLFVEFPPSAGEGNFSGEVIVTLSKNI